MPVPTAPPGYNPYEACVVSPCAPAPQLGEPQDGTKFTAKSKIELKWTWTYCLPPDWKFAVRISGDYPPHSHRYEDNPVFISCQDGKTTGRYLIDEDSAFSANAGTYYWNIAVARSVEGGWERLSEESEIRMYSVELGESNGSCPVPPCD